MDKGGIQMLESLDIGCAADDLFLKNPDNSTP